MSFSWPALVPYRACVGQVATVMSSGTLNAKVKRPGVWPKRRSQYASLGNW